MTVADREAVIRAMQRARLTPKKLAIMFMALAGWRQREIAEVLQLSQPTISYHYRDSVDRLTALYRPDDFDIARE